MKNFIKGLAFSAITVFSFQAAQAQSSFGIKGGLNVSELATKMDELEEQVTEAEANIGFHVGAFADIGIVGNYLSLQPEVHFSSKGNKVIIKEALFNTTIETKSTTYYIDVPVNVKASFGIGQLFRVYGMAGPYFSFGVGGEVKTSNEILGSNPIEIKDKIKWGSESSDQFKRFDTGVSVGAGFEISKFVFGASYDLGLYNISTVEEEAMKINNRVLKISAGVKF